MSTSGSPISCACACVHVCVCDCVCVCVTVCACVCARASLCNCVPYVRVLSVVNVSTAGRRGLRQAHTRGLPVATTTFRGRSFPAVRGIAGGVSRPPRIQTHYYQHHAPE